MRINCCRSDGRNRNLLSRSASSIKMVARTAGGSVQQSSRDVQRGRFLRDGLSASLIASLCDHDPCDLSSSSGSSYLRVGMSIFVSIAAYRDPELVPTLRDCLRRARYPDDLRFGICWQHTADEAIPSEFADHRMRVIDVPWQNSQGACWARSEIMKLWDGEHFFLQLDSHHRFVQDWDALLLSLAEGSGAAKPLLTTYGAPFDPRSAAPENGEPMQMDFDHFTADGSRCSVRGQFLIGGIYSVHCALASSRLIFCSRSAHSSRKCLTIRTCTSTARRSRSRSAPSREAIPAPSTAACPMARIHARLSHQALG